MSKKSYGIPKDATKKINWLLCLTCDSNKSSSSEIVVTRAGYLGYALKLARENYISKSDFDTVKNVFYDWDEFKSTGRKLKDFVDSIPQNNQELLLMISDVYIESIIKAKKGIDGNIQTARSIYLEIAKAMLADNQITIEQYNKISSIFSNCDEYISSGIEFDDFITEEDKELFLKVATGIGKHICVCDGREF